MSDIRSTVACTIVVDCSHYNTKTAEKSTYVLRARTLKNCCCRFGCVTTTREITSVPCSFFKHNYGSTGCTTNDITPEPQTRGAGDRRPSRRSTGSSKLFGLPVSSSELSNEYHRVSKELTCGCERTPCRSIRVFGVALLFVVQG